MKFDEYYREYKIIEEHYAKSDRREMLVEDAQKRLRNGEPLAYIIGEQAFYNLVFKVNSDVLIPRPDTERVVEKAIKLLPDGARFADICTGSGCIAVTVLANRADTSAMALDISEKAIEVAVQNAKNAGVSQRIEFIKADLLGSGIPSDEKFDMIISNPPYIQSDVISQYPSLAYEPIIALDGGDDGLIFYRYMLKNLLRNLKPNGKFIFEIGYDQAEQIKEICRELNYCCEIYKDYGGNDRVAVAERVFNENTGL